jgi:two-component system, OmpR family, sensor kinase
VKLSRWRHATVSASAVNDQMLLRRTGRRAAMQTAVTLSVFLAVVGLVAYVLNVHVQNGQINAQLSSVVASADDVVDPPPGGALAMRAANGSVAVSPQAPAAAARLTDGPVGYSSVYDGGRRYRALVVDRSGTRVVALLDLAPWETARRQLLIALALAEFVGMLAIAVVVAMLSRRAIRPLATALALQRRFVADASHELRAPLTLLHTRAQILARNADRQNVDKNLSTQLEELVADTRALGDVVEDLLLAASLESAPGPRERERVDLRHLAEEVRAATATYAQTLGIAVLVDDAAAQGALLTGSRSALRRALIALIDNALAYEKPGGRVVLRPVRNATTVSIAVIDTGAGLDPHTAGELFTRFAHRDGHTAAGRHYGLGLALVREIVDHHHGHITVTGAPGRGATFTLIFPAAEGDSPG